MNLTETEQTALDILSQNFEKVYKIGRDGSNADTDAAKIFKHFPFIGSKGCPDIIAWNSENDYKFVEIKKKNDTLTKTQLEWLTKHAENHDVEVWYFDSENKRDFTSKQLNNIFFERIPQALKLAMGWEKGDQLEFQVKDSETLEVKKKQ